MKTRRDAAAAKVTKVRVLKDEALVLAVGGASARRVRKTFTTTSTRIDPYKSFNFR